MAVLLPVMPLVMAARIASFRPETGLLYRPAAASPVTTCFLVSFITALLVRSSLRDLFLRFERAGVM